MPTLSASERGNDPCLQIQVDLSAMLDGELDTPSVRRVMVHSDVCPSCRGFLDGIRSQARLHRTLEGRGILNEASGARMVGAATPGRIVAEGQPVDGELRGGGEDTASERLRRQLTANRRKLAKILYELGRGFVLMGLSPDISREVAKQPMPVPDMAMRGRNLLDEVARGPGGGGSEWVAANELFEHGQLNSPAENLAKGQRLLNECLALEPELHEARIYLGLVHHVRGQRSLARKQFLLVMTGTKDPVMRGFALLSLGNVHLDEGDCGSAVALLLELVESGVVGTQPHLGMAYFNLGLAYGLQGQFEECLRWFRKLHDEMPHRRANVARELSRRIQFLHLLRSHPDTHRAFTQSCPSWFSSTPKEAC